MPSTLQQTVQPKSKDEEWIPNPDLLNTISSIETQESPPASPTDAVQRHPNDAKVVIGTCSVVGDDRVHVNEDRFKVVTDLFARHAPPGVKYSGTPSRQVAFLGVYDGHGGTDVAELLRHKLHKLVARNLYPVNHHTSVSNALAQSFLQTEERYFRTSLAGSCCTAVLLKERSLYCANAGDSGAVLLPYSAKPFKPRGKPIWLCERHTVYLSKNEKKRLKRAGAEIAAIPGLEDAIVCRSRRDREIHKAIYPTRCFGDADFKDLTRPISALIVEPTGRGVGHEGDAVTLTGKGPWLLVVACDGLWDFVSQGQVMKNIFQGNIERSPTAIAEGLVKLAQNPPANSDDDTTVIVAKVSYD